MEYVKSEAKIVYLLECLQKTPPPVLIFAEKKQDVDNIHEYLLLKGVEAVAIHGGKGNILHGHTFLCSVKLTLSVLIMRRDSDDAYSLLKLPTNSM